METKDLLLRKAVFEDWPAIWRNVWSDPHHGERYLLKCFEKEKEQ